MSKFSLNEQTITATPTAYTGLSVQFSVPAHVTRYTFFVYTDGSLNPTQPTFQALDESELFFTYVLDGITWIYQQDSSKSRAVIYNPHPFVVYDWQKVGLAGLGFGTAPTANTNIIIGGVAWDG